MVNKYLNRRSFLATFGTFSLLPAIAQAEEFIDLEWTDLLQQDKQRIRLRPTISFSTTKTHF